MADAIAKFKGTTQQNTADTFTVITIDGTDIESIDQDYCVDAELYAVCYATNNSYHGSASNTCQFGRIGSSNVFRNNGTVRKAGSTLDNINLSFSGTDIYVDVTLASAGGATIDVMAWAVLRIYKP